VKLLLNKIFPLLGFVCLLTFGSCTKIDPTDLGTELIPAVDNIYTFDTTLDVEAYNELFDDSTYPVFDYTSSGSLPDHPVGFISNDPQFGKLSSTLYLQLKPTSFPYSFGTTKDSLFLDSVVLCLQYKSVWGDTNAIQTLKVYELEGKIKPDSAYKINTFFDFNEQLGVKSFTPNILDDSLKLFKENLKNQLRIPLSESFGNSLLAQDSSGAYKSDSAFTEFLNGFAIVPETAGSQANALMYYNLLGSNTYLKLYYKRKLPSGGFDTTSRNFTFSPLRTGQAVYITRNIDGSQLRQQITNTASVSDSLIYLAATPGSFATLKTRSVEGFKSKKGNVVIHKASLIVQQVASNGEKDEVFRSPDYLFLDGYDTSLMLFRPIPYDFSFNRGPNLDQFGGLVKEINDAQGNVISQYTFTLTRYMQGYITRHEPLMDLRLYAPYLVEYPEFNVYFGLNSMSRGRVKLGGTGHSRNKIKIHLVYSVL
jgi:Domain of unknown function (DUF4270)